MHLHSKRRRLLVIVVTLVLLASLGIAAGWRLSGTSSTPLVSRRAEIEARLARGEGQRLCNEIVETREWERLLAQVQAGEPAALHLAVLLCDVADTHPGEELFEAMAAALSSNPGWMLRNAKLCRVGLPTICGWPASDEPPDPVGSIAALERRASAIRDVDAPGVEEERTKCLAKIEELRRLAL